tara:strand:+ start:260 stop:376 length:117 start_codon:yes stop_codon:yes gene_type:complete
VAGWLPIKEKEGVGKMIETILITTALLLIVDLFLSGVL